MERKGQLNLLIGVILAIISMILGWAFIPDYEWIDFLTGVVAGLGLVFVILGLIQVIRAKRNKK